MKKALRKSNFMSGILIVTVVCLGIVFAGNVVVKQGTAQFDSIGIGTSPASSIGINVTPQVSSSYKGAYFCPELTPSSADQTLTGVEYYARAKPSANGDIFSIFGSRGGVDIESGFIERVDSVKV